MYDAATYADASVNIGSTDYAVLTDDLSQVAYVQAMSPDFINTLLGANPDLGFLPVVMTDKPDYDPATQMVSQNGWSVMETSVQPIWVISGLTTQQATEASVLNLDDLAGYVAGWGSLTSGQKDTALQRALTIIVLLLQKYLPH